MKEIMKKWKKWKKYADEIQKIQVFDTTERLYF